LVAAETKSVISRFDFAIFRLKTQTALSFVWSVWFPSAAKEEKIYDRYWREHHNKLRTTVLDRLDH
jgi:hypothetical protein